MLGFRALRQDLTALCRVRMCSLDLLEQVDQSTRRTVPGHENEGRRKAQRTPCWGLLQGRCFGPTVLLNLVCVDFEAMETNPPARAPLAG